MMYFTLSDSKTGSLPPPPCLFTGICHARRNENGGRRSKKLNKMKEVYKTNVAYALRLVDGKFIGERLIISCQSNTETRLQKASEAFNLTCRKRNQHDIIFRKKKLKRKAGDLPQSRLPSLFDAVLRLECVVAGVVCGHDVRQTLTGVNATKILCV